MAGQHANPMICNKKTNARGAPEDIITEMFHNLAMRVKVRSTPEEGSSVAELVAELRQFDCLFFDDA